MTKIDTCNSYRRTVLDNGLRIVTEHIPHIRSLAIGFWFDVGSRDEPDDLAGIAHFIEHMNFKGTPLRSAAAIARQIEGRGGHLNAFTGKENTCYHARIVDQQLPKAIDILSDITQNSVFDSDEINRERKVILEELKSVEDTPDELVFEYFIAQMFNPHSMGRSVLGKRDKLETIDHNVLVDYREKHYGGSRAVIAAAGNLDHNRLVKMIERRFSSRSTVGQSRKPPSDKITEKTRQDLHTNTQQTHICWGCRSFSYKDPRKFSLLVLNTLLGGGMSSRLFQTIRERHGLAYTVFSFIETYLDTGLFGVYAGTEPKQAEKTLRMIKKELMGLVRKPVSNRTLQRTKDQLKGNLILGLESAGNRMHRLAKMELYNTDWLSLDDIVSRIDAVTVEDVQAVACDLFEQRTGYTTILWPN
ncbi:MAG: pitrilysin family protein [Candidatus Hatepunaea meridiana]|nr:pitrilysin family protein [Candidatus Hatepunaea meridiana]